MIDRCLQKHPSARFSDGEEMATALTPASEGRPELPLPLRNWLSVRNPAHTAYGVWSGLLGIPIISELSAYAQWHHASTLGNLAILVGLAAIPVVPMIGFHATRSRRLFGSGFTVADCVEHWTSPPPNA